MIAVGFLILFTLPTVTIHSYSFFFCFALSAQQVNSNAPCNLDSILPIPLSYIRSFFGFSRVGKWIQTRHFLKKCKKKIIWFSVLAIEIGQRDHAICLLWIYILIITCSISIHQLIMITGIDNHNYMRMYRDYEFSIDLLNQLNAWICTIHQPMYNVICVVLMTFVSR